LATIRNYQPGDRDACRELWVVLTQRHREIYEAPWIGGDDPGRQFDDHLDRVGASRLWVADDEGQLVGLSGLILEEGSAELEPLVVRPSHQGRGLGKRLVDPVRSAAVAAGASTLTVKAVARNTDAIRFYRRAGFAVLGFVEMFEDLREDSPATWVDGESLAGVKFLV